MLTLEKVKFFREELDFVCSQCDDLLSSRSRQKMFSSADAKDLERNAALRYPSDYYFFRDYDVAIELRVDRRSDFYICVQGKYSFSSLDFTPVPTKHNWYYAASYSQILQQKEKALGEPLDAFSKDQLKFFCLNESVVMFRRAVAIYLHDKMKSKEELDFVLL